MVTRWITMVALLLAWTGCDGGSGGGGGPDTQEPAADSATEPDSSPPQDLVPAEDSPPAADTPPPEDTPPVVDPKCAALVENWNPAFDVDGEDRSLILELPTGLEEGGPWPVVFNWHGFGDTAANMNNLLKAAVDDHGFKFILVTPEDTNPLMGDGLDWMIVNVAEGNKEARLFDEVLECLDQRWGVDWDHVHSVGFSAGAVCSDLIGTLRGDVLASSVSFSGVYFSNPANDIALTDWVEPTGMNPYAQLIMHGGTKDTWGVPPFIEIHFDQAAQNDRAWLNGRGHDVVFCAHSLGHTIPFDFSASTRVAQFFRDHKRGSASPYMDALPAEFQKYCEPSPGAR
ncbi:MAG: hypothetical protein FJ098_12010 [Deltaproteobacteria bacterium]|nr:hypothetical protein [Deltaproteobacteria bacterium]